MNDEFGVTGEWLDEKTVEFLRQHFDKEMKSKENRYNDLKESQDAKSEFIRVKFGIDGDAQLDPNGVEFDFDARGRGKLSWKTFRNLLVLSRSIKKIKPPT